MAARLVLLLASGHLAASEFAPNFRSNSSLLSEKLRQDILGRPYFSRIVAPTSDRKSTGTDYSDAGTDVFMQIRFFKVQTVNAAEGWMRLKVWMRMGWKDTRLAWDPNDYSGLDTTFFQGDNMGGSEVSEIWIPDVQPYNANNGIILTLEPALARVSSDGSVFLSRPGSLEIMCKFSGLVAFPFDNLTCAVEFGGWSLSGGYQGLNFTGAGYVFSSQELTAGSSYQENEIVNVDVSLVQYTYPCCPSEPWPVALYTITLSRSWFFYVPIVIVPGIVITLMSFAVFWSDTGSSDALGYGIAVIVVNLLGNIVLISLLPICGELIWIDLFGAVNTGFCIIALFQSAFNIMLEQKSDDSLLPTWMDHLYVKFFRPWIVRGKSQVGMRDSVLKISKYDRQSAAEAVSHMAAHHTLHESVAGVLFRQQAGSVEYEEEKKRKNLQQVAAASFEERGKKLTNFERIFFALDEDCSLYIDRIECESLLSYAALHLDPKTRSSIMDVYDKEEDGKLNRVEFCRMCVDHLWDLNEEQLERALNNAQAARSGVLRRNKKYWKEMADWTDSWARIIVPALYGLTLLLVFNLDLSDNYLTDASAPMFNGMGPAAIRPDRGVAMLTSYCIIAFVCFGMYVFMKSTAAADKVKRDAALKQAASRVAEAASEKDERYSAIPKPGRLIAGGETESFQRRMRLPASSVSIEASTV